MKNIKTLFTAIVLLLCTSNAIAQTNKTFFLGHSLINFHIPNMVNKLSIDASQNFSYDANIGIGASLGWHWASPSSAQGDQWDLTLPNGGYENFIITEALKLDDQLAYNTYRIVDSFYIFAQQHNPNIKYYMFETWHCTSSGTDSATTACAGDSDNGVLWRDRLDIDLPKWESIADSINLIHTNPMMVIPGGQAFARLSDSINAGAVPGLTSVFDLYVDEYHLDERGNYFMACVMYSVIHGESPVGLANQLTDQFDVLYTEYPSVVLAEAMQEIAWETVCEYQRDGVNCTTDTTLNNDTTVIDPTTSINLIAKNYFNLYPNPSSNIINIDLKNSDQAVLKVLDVSGRILIQRELYSKHNTIDVSQISNGMFLVQIEINHKKLVKKIIIQ